MSSAGFVRRSAIELTFIAVTAFAPASSACASVLIVPMPMPIQPPLSAMARWNRPLASGDPTSPEIRNAPADSPKIVTRRVSPPNAAAFLCTHCSAAMASITP